MKSFVSSVLLAVTASAGYLQENSYTFMDATKGKYTGALQTLTDANGYVMTVDVQHIQDEDDNFVMNMCLDLTVPAPTNSREYYWGLNFKPAEPKVESTWDGV